MSPVLVKWLKCAPGSKGKQISKNFIVGSVQVNLSPNFMIMWTPNFMIMWTYQHHTHCGNGFCYLIWRAAWPARNFNSKQLLYFNCCICRRFRIGIDSLCYVHVISLYTSRHCTKRAMWHRLVLIPQILQAKIYDERLWQIYDHLSNFVNICYI